MSDHMSFSEGHVSFYLIAPPPPHPPIQCCWYDNYASDMRLSNFVNIELGEEGLQQKLWAFKSVEKVTRILSSKFQCVSTSFVQDCSKAYRYKRLKVRIHSYL